MFTTVLHHLVSSGDRYKLWARQFSTHTLWLLSQAVVIHVVQYCLTNMSGILCKDIIWAAASVSPNPEYIIDSQKKSQIWAHRTVKLTQDTVDIIFTGMVFIQFIFSFYCCAAWGPRAHSHSIVVFSLVPFILNILILCNVEDEISNVFAILPWVPYSLVNKIFANKVLLIKVFIRRLDFIEWCWLSFKTCHLLQLII